MNLSKDIAYLKLMHTHLLENPFGVWNKIPELPENASLNESQKFDLLWNETATEDISESEVSDYLQRLAEKSSLNEYAERGWFGISPFAWTEGFRVSSIFKPLKWLAVPLIGGTVLLLAGIWKLLKEGKKQIAISKVRAWIEKLVVTADSGLKKTRNTKDSLFLIRQRYRRDILQNAVKVATCLGIDIPEKDTKPSSVETSLNESLEPNSIMLANIYYYINAVTLRFNIPIGSTGDSRILDVTFDYYDTKKKNIKATIYKKNGEVLSNDSPEVQEIIKDFTNVWNIEKGSVYDKIVEDKKNTGLKVSVGDTLEEIASKYSPNVNPEEQEENKEEEVKDDNIQQDPNDSSINVEDSSDGDNVADSNVQTTHEVPEEIPSQSQLPDDSRVDWSLMNSVTASQWFGLKHKTTNFWKEAKSVAVIDTTTAQGNTLRECGLITSYVSQSLTLVANSSVAQSYTSIMNKYVEALTKIKASDSVLKQQGSRPVYNNRFSSSNNVYDSKYEMFKDDFKIFEATNEYRSMIFTWWSDKGFQEYLKEIGEFQKVQDQIFSQISINNYNIPESKFKYLESLYIKYNEEKLGQMIDILGSEEEQPSPRRREDISNVDYSRINPDNIDKYLIAALSKILANTNYNEWQMHSDAYNQMMKFINELTKTVHTVIDSVAKKVEEKIGSTGNTFEQAVLRFISSKPDAKQNRSLKNLWDNIGVSKLQQRTIVHCQEIDASPEMQYYLDMFMITVPSVIKSKLLPQEEKRPTDTTVDSSTNIENGNL